MSARRWSRRSFSKLALVAASLPLLILTVRLLRAQAIVLGRRGY